jgi:transcriptional regulator with XRE-family HTH domain
MSESKLRQLREKTGKSLVAFALEVGMEPGYLSMVERGKRVCKENASRLADALGVSAKSIWNDYDKLPHNKQIKAERWV